MRASIELTEVLRGANEVLHHVLEYCFSETPFTLVNDHHETGDPRRSVVLLVEPGGVEVRGGTATRRVIEAYMFHFPPPGVYQGSVC